MYPYIQVAHNKGHYQAPMNEVMNLRVPLKTRHFSNKLIYMELFVRTSNTAFMNMSQSYSQKFRQKYCGQVQINNYTFSLPRLENHVNALIS